MVKVVSGHILSLLQLKALYESWFFNTTLNYSRNCFPIIHIVQSKHDIFIKRKASCLAAGLFGRSWNGLSGRGWNGLLGRGWNGLSGRGWNGLSGRGWNGLSGRGWNVSCTFTPRSNLSKYIGIIQNYLN